MRRLIELPLTLVHVCRVLRALPRIETQRRGRGVGEWVAFARNSSAGKSPHSERSRRCLRRAILWVDGSLPDGGNCCRRALLEMALDPQAATRPFAMGFSVKDRQLSGHAWLESSEPSPDRYDFVIQL